MSKSVLVSGASRGIGLHTALKFVRDDNGIDTVVVVARESQALREAECRLREGNVLGKSIHVHAADLADRQAIVTLAKQVAEHGNIDVLVNNAGMTVPASIQQIDFDDFQRTMTVNVYAPFTLVQELLRNGNVFQAIVNVASTAGLQGRPGWLTYSASKAALISMSETMREELAIYGTRVVTIAPGRCATDLRRQLAPDEDPSTIMQPEDVAEVISMLASDVGRFIDSQRLVVRL
jgi:3-oxoacyl-[acyl-carrier protein] reductase